jgi:hypothetical protein
MAARAENNTGKAEPVRVLSLAALDVGQKGKITAVPAGDNPTDGQTAALGVFPDLTVCLRQKISGFRVSGQLHQNRGGWRHCVSRSG